MKKIDVSFALDPVRQPVMARSMSHLQESYQEAIDAIIKSLSYDPTKPIILYGCVNSTIAPIYTLSAGAIYWLGEIYLVDAVTFTSAGSDVAIASIVTTYQTGDPTIFSDNSSHNVHEIRKIVFSSAASGSSIFDFSNTTDIYKNGGGVRVQTSTSTGDTVEVNIVSSGPFTYNNLITKYSYKIANGVCHLDFEITFDVTDGAVIDQIKIPLPENITKATTGARAFASIGTCVFNAPGSATDYAIFFVLSNDDGSEGNRLVIERSSDGTQDITISTSSSVLLKGHIDFDII